MKVEVSWRPACTTSNPKLQSRQRVYFRTSFNRNPKARNSEDCLGQQVHRHRDLLFTSERPAAEDVEKNYGSTFGVFLSDSWLWASCGKLSPKAPDP